MVTDHLKIIFNKCFLFPDNKFSDMLISVPDQDVHMFLFQKSADRGTYVWDSKLQGYILSSFFYGYVLTQIPFGIMAKKYGAKYFLGVGMLINSLFGLLVPVGANGGIVWLIVVRFIQGLGEVSAQILY